MNQLATQQEVFKEVQKIMTMPDFQRYGAEVELLVAECKKVKIRDDQSERLAVDKVSQVRTLSKKLDERRKTGLEKYQGIIKAVNNAVRQWTEPLDEAERHLKNEIRRYRAEIELQRKKEEEEARKLAEKARERVTKQAEKIGIEPPKIPDPVIPKRDGTVRGESGGKVAGRKIWKAELVDIMELAKAVSEGRAMKELLQFNQTLGNTLARQGVTDIPGVRIYQEDSLSIYTT